MTEPKVPKPARQAPRKRVRGISLRTDQWTWLYAEADRQRHGNTSRIVQDALDAYQAQRTQEDRHDDL
jgi:hypothetical protein